METMKARSEWYGHVEKEVGRYRESLSQKDYKKYRLDMLVRVAGRVDDFSATCGECQILKQDITTLLQDLNYVSGMSAAREKRRIYLKKIDNIIKHLKKKHRLVNEGEYMGIWTAMGTAIGVAIGAGSENISIGIPIGVAIGIAVGAYLDRKAKKEDRVI
jgi:hypothetical protein